MTITQHEPHDRAHPRCWSARLRWTAVATLTAVSLAGAPAGLTPTAHAAPLATDTPVVLPVVAVEPADAPDDHDLLGRLPLLVELAARVTGLDLDPLLRSLGPARVDNGLVPLPAPTPDPAPAEPEELGYRTPVTGEWITVERVADYLREQGSPLAPHAHEIVESGIAHDVDPRVVIGIATIESGLGERLPSGTHNAWGWSGSGPYGLKAWPSWPAAIDDYTERLGRLYTADDLANVDVAFAQTYVPPNWEHWLEVVHLVGERI